MIAMRVLGLAKKKLLKCSILQTINNLNRGNSSFFIVTGGPLRRTQTRSEYSTIRKADVDIEKDIEKVTLANNLATLLEESVSVDSKRPKSRMELKRYLELRIKKKVKEQNISGKFQDLMDNVIAKAETLHLAFNCIKINSNVDISIDKDATAFESMAEELFSENFDVNANTFSISTKGSRKDTIVLPNLKLKVLQEAIRIVLEVIYKPHFSKISHGFRSGRGHCSALKYIRKEINNPDWWFTISVKKKMDCSVFAKLMSIMEDKIEDPKLYSIIRKMFDAEVLNFEFGGFPKGHGLPQEGVLSPILMNMYLDLFDREFYRLSMKYEALNPDFHSDHDEVSSMLRNFFRRQLKKNGEVNCTGKGILSTRVYCCRFMDEIFVAVSGSKDLALSFKSDIENYLQNSLHLHVDNQEEEILSCVGPHGIRFLGIVVKRIVKESPAAKAVHKLKEKVELFALQKEEAWNAGTVKIGMKCLGHGLKKVKESEIKHLADNSSALSQISSFRKPGMKTDHWYKVLLKIWMQDVKAKAAESEEIMLSKYIAEPALPQELIDSFYEFQRHAKAYVSSETASTLALLPNSSSATKSLSITEIIAPVNVIKKRLFRYGLITFEGYPRNSSLLILQDNIQIINWFSGIVHRWLKWYSDCDNFGEVKLLICDQIRKSCIKTLAAKYRVHESVIEKQLDLDLSRIPSTEEIEEEIKNNSSVTHSFDIDEALNYGISYSGLCLLSLARMVSKSRPCNCFVMGCLAPAPSVYTLHVMERQKFPGWKTGFSSCIHPSLNRRRIGLCSQHLNDLYLGTISLQSIDFGAWK